MVALENPPPRSRSNPVDTVRNLRVSTPKPRITATPCSISQKPRILRKTRSQFDGVCLLAMTGTHDCSVDHDKENASPQEGAAKQGSEEAKPRSLRDFRINRIKSRGTECCITWAGFLTGREGMVVSSEQT